MNDEGMETMLEAMSRLRADGFTSNWLAVPSGRLRDADSGAVFEAGDLVIHEIVRFEGASDPDDEAILYALSCPVSKGLFATAFGPNTPVDDADVLAQLPLRPTP